MKILAGRLTPSAGDLRVGHQVIVSYFSQDQDDLLSSPRTVWEEVYSVAPSHIVPELRTLLGCFLFSGDSIEKPVSVLSGGERSRLVLCRLLLSPANCLLLDEPTNHLDIRSKDILMDSLREYGGTLVFVSHDRYFLDGLATKVLEIGGGKAVVYLGNYEDYLVRKKSEAGAAGTPSAPHEETGTPAAADEAPAKRKRVNPLRVRELQSRIAELEGEISTHETRVAVLARMLSSEDLYKDYTLFRSTMDEHDRLQAELAEKMARWEQMQAELESIGGAG
jgi:ATP-binding cassette subfamily F protein 3